MFELGTYIACIAEGGAETVIIDILLDNHLLIFERESLLDESVLRCRSAEEFERRYLRKGFDGKITVFRILDSRRENFRLGKAYQHKVDVINIITAPEIEMLIILNEDKYDAFKKSRMKPSQFCKAEMGYKSVKTRAFVSKYFADCAILVSAIKKYAEVSKAHGHEHTLFELLKQHS